MDGTVVVAGRLVVFIHFFLGPFFFFKACAGLATGSPYWVLMNGLEA